MIAAIVMGGYIVMGLIGIGLLVFFGFLIRGRPHRVTPACPRCRYCLVGTLSTTCPECGNDLDQSGVYLNGRRRLPRLVRAIIVIFIALLSLLPYRYVTQQVWQNWAKVTFGNRESWSGSVTGSMNLNSQLCASSHVTVIYPDPAVHDYIKATSYDEIYYWNPPEPVRLMMVQPDGSQRDYVIESVSSDHARWEIHRVMPMAGPPDPDFSAGPEVAESVDDLYRVISERLDRDGDTPPGEDPGPRVAAAFAQMMVKAMMAEDGVYTVGSHPDQGRAAVRTGVNVATTRSPYVQRVSGSWFMLSSWLVFWLIVLLIMIAPGTPTDPWEPGTTD